MKELIDFTSLDEVFGFPPRDKVWVDLSECCEITQVARPWNLGVTHDEETRKKISDAHKGRIIDGEWARKISQSKMGHPVTEDNLKKLIASRVNTFTIKSPCGKIITRTNMSEFCREFNLHKGCVSQVLSGKLLQHKGWTKPNIK